MEASIFASVYAPDPASQKHPQRPSPSSVFVSPPFIFFIYPPYPVFIIYNITLNSINLHHLLNALIAY
jgi:hypothetical protein